FLGTFTFSSSLLVSVVALHGVTNERNEFLSSTVPVGVLAGYALDSLTKDTLGTIAQFADGGGWKTRIVLVNRSDAAVDGEITLYEKTGDLMPVTLNGTTKSVFIYSLPPRSSRELRSAGILRNVQVGSIGIVSASVPADAAPMAFALLQYAADGA